MKAIIRKSSLLVMVALLMAASLAAHAITPLEFIGRFNNFTVRQSEELDHSAFKRMVYDNGVVAYKAYFYNDKILFEYEVDDASGDLRVFRAKLTADNDTAEAAGEILAHVALRVAMAAEPGADVFEMGNRYAKLVEGLLANGASEMQVGTGIMAISVFELRETAAIFVEYRPDK